VRGNPRLGATVGVIALVMAAGCGRAAVEAAAPTKPGGVAEEVAPPPEEVAPPPVEVAPPVEVTPPPPPPMAGTALRARYALTGAKQTLTGDHGAGYDDLYGTRNVRAVLDGVFYRGGANNQYHRTDKRHNKNPLPTDGLENLCRQGFGAAIYLYPTRYDTAAKETTCQTVDGGEGHLAYEQISTQHGKKADLRAVFAMIMLHIAEPQRGAIYAHCWNGWHASGYLGAVALRQFCGFTGAEAVRYWNQTAKGASNADHDSTKDRITKFKPFPEYVLTDEQRAAMCPDRRTFAFSR
jgi:hypothetical protein